MVPVVYLNEFGSGLDDFLNLGLVSPSCDQMIWSRDSRCDVERAPGKYFSIAFPYQLNDRRTEHHHGTATGNVRDTNTFRATSTLVEVANPNPLDIPGPH